MIQDDVVLKNDGTPFETLGDAKRRAGSLLKSSGIRYEAIENEDGDGFVLVESARKKQRVPLHQRVSLRSYQIPGFKTRYVKDVEGRIKMFEEAGWVKVLDTEFMPHDDTIQKASRKGSYVTAAGGRGITLYLMKIPTRLYEEDQASKQAELDKVEAQIRNQPNEMGADGVARYGNVKVEYGERK